MNEYAAAKMVGDYKGRFGLFAVLPLPDVPGSLQEVEYAFDTLKADGVGVLTSYGNAWLGDRVVHAGARGAQSAQGGRLHASDRAACCQNMIPRVANQMLEYPTDTTRTIVSLHRERSATSTRTSASSSLTLAARSRRSPAGCSAPRAAENLRARRAELEALSPAALLLRHRRRRRIR